MAAPFCESESSDSSNTITKIHPAERWCSIAMAECWSAATHRGSELIGIGAARTPSGQSCALCSTLGTMEEKLVMVVRQISRELSKWHQVVHLHAAVAHITE